MSQGSDIKLWQTSEQVPYLAHREHKSDLLCEEAASDEGKRTGRLAVKPLCVIDDAQQWLFVGRFGQETEDSQSDQEDLGSLSGAQPQGDGKRLPLRKREVFDELEAG
jgi:hypothetical protein